MGSGSTVIKCARKSNVDICILWLNNEKYWDPYGLFELNTKVNEFLQHQPLLTFYNYLTFSYGLLQSFPPHMIWSKTLPLKMNYWSAPLTKLLGLWSNQARHQWSNLPGRKVSPMSSRTTMWCWQISIWKAKSREEKLCCRKEKEKICWQLESSL